MCVWGGWVADPETHQYCSNDVYSEALRHTHISRASESSFLLLIFELFISFYQMQSYSTSHPIIFNMKSSALGPSLSLVGLIVHGHLGPKPSGSRLISIELHINIVHKKYITLDSAIRQYTQREREWPANVRCLKGKTNWKTK